MLQQSNDVEILRFLYADARAPGGDWAQSLPLLATMTRARAVTLLIETRGTLQRVALGPKAPLPPQPRLEALRHSRVYAQDEFEAQTGMLRVIRVDPIAGLRGWLCLWHPFTDFRAVDTVLLGRIAPYLEQALEIWLDAGAERARQARAEALAHNLGAGWLWLDPTGRVVEASETARNALLRGTALRLTVNGRIEGRNPVAGRDFRRALDLALAGAEGPHLVTLDETAHAELAIEPGLAAPAPGIEPSLRAVVRWAPDVAGRDLAALARALGLNRSEARLTALICDGNSLAEAAAVLGWTLETARSCSKKIYAQTGTRGQPDLLRSVLNGACVASLAAPS
ncbi:hypothetical protein JI664_16940 [Rhodobacter sp. NTK016B]|uniref:helix-turn-helix transcriptional regulator n=1 Tax=Rhodobacter sp. NTK016B TaxID=2759676 RepID=UPI001A8D772C|nr:hypothetical protein [Rhodobacter sp. NTK016B]MBN8293661.1 hypothetical protein [Rhodobacter sp. NTK016B]